MRRAFTSTLIVAGLVAIASTAGFCADQPLRGTAGPDMKGDAKPASQGKTGSEAKPVTAAEESMVKLKLPLFSPLFDRTPIATVNDEPIRLEELKAALMGIHQQATGGKTGLKKDYLKILNRLISTRLIVAEAANMGLDETPDVKNQIDAFKMDHLRDLLKRQQFKDIKPDAKLVEQFYRDAVKEWKIRSVKIDKKEEADALAKQVAAGGSFDVLADKLINSGKAEGVKEGSFVKPSVLLPYIGSVVDKLKIGSISPVMAVGPAFTVIKLEDVRYPAGNVQARDEAEKKALDVKRADLLTKLNDSLVKKYATIDKKLLKKLDFEAPKPGFKKLLNDKRVVARIKGDPPITVGDLAQSLAGKFFHGIDEAIRQREVNSIKQPVLNNLLYRATFIHEAKRLGIDQSEEYKKDVEEFRNSLLFGEFVKVVIASQFKVKDEEIAAYYKEHLKEFTYPPMLKVQALVFQKKNLAEDAIAKLKKGTDFDWIKNNAEGQVEKAKSEDMLEFSGKLLSVNSFPEGVQEALREAKAEDIKLYASPEGYFFLLQVKNVVAAKVSPLENERKRIFTQLFAERLNKQVEEWAGKLAKAYPVKIFITDGSN